MANTASQYEKIGLYLTLLFISIAVVYGTLRYIDNLQTQQSVLLSVPFSPLTVSTIRPYQSLFTTTLIKKNFLSKAH